MRHHGFTIIELTITLAITLVLVSIGIPRYNALLVQQEFFSEVQKVAACIQQAQSLAAAPRSDLLALSGGNAVSARWVAAFVSAADSTGNRSCSVVAMDATTPLSSLSLNSPSDQLAQPLTTSGIQRLSMSSFRMYFGVEEKGMPVKYIDDTLLPNPKTADVPATGIKVSVAITSSVDSTQTANLVIEQGGAPIRIVKP
jgi:prepilin-type N-terminal cleavage/methylation domain-containing protein